MDLTRFKDCCAAYGADRRRWPPREHALYDRFAGTPEGVAILAEAGRIDNFLDALEPARPDARRMADVSLLPGPRWRRIASPVAALAACAALGFIAGCLQSRDTADIGFVAELLMGPETLRELGL